MHTNDWTTQEHKKWLLQSASSFTRLEIAMRAIALTIRTQVRRHAERAVYDLEGRRLALKKNAPAICP
jgi:hypothetical protein